MNILDAHAHAIINSSLDHLYPKGIEYPSVKELLNLYDKVSIDKGILLPVVSPEAQWRNITNEDIYRIVKKHSDRFFWTCNIDPRNGENNRTTSFYDTLSRYKDYGAKGVGEMTCSLYLDDPLVKNLFYYCAEAEMPVTIHISDKISGTYGLVDDINLSKLDRVLSEFPSLIIIGHAQCFWRAIAPITSPDLYPTDRILVEGALQKLLRKHKNLYCDLSAKSGSNALFRDKEYAYKFIHEFHDRLVFGLDVCDISDQLYSNKVVFFQESLKAQKISQAEYKNISYRNAYRIYQL